MSRLKKKQIRRANKVGKSNLEVCMMREIARKEADKMAEEAEKIATEKAFLFMLGIPLNILLHDYWPKSAKKRMPKFIKEVLSLYEAVEIGVVTYDEISDLVYDLSGVRYQAEWMKVRKCVE